MNAKIDQLLAGNSKIDQILAGMNELKPCFPTLAAREKELDTLVSLRLKNVLDEYHKLWDDATNSYLDRFDIMIKDHKNTIDSINDMFNHICKGHDQYVKYLKDVIYEHQKHTVVLEQVVVKTMASVQALANIPLHKYDELHKTFQDVLKTLRDQQPSVSAYTDLSRQISMSFTKVLDKLRDMQVGSASGAGGSNAEGGEKQPENIVDLDDNAPPSPQFFMLNLKDPVYDTTYRFNKNTKQQMIFNLAVKVVGERLQEEAAAAEQAKKEAELRARIPQPNPPIAPIDDVNISKEQDDGISNKGKGTAEGSSADAEREMDFHVKLRESGEVKCALEICRKNAEGNLVVVDHVVSPWNPEAKLEPQDLVPYKSYELPSSRDDLLDLPISPHAEYYVRFPVMSPELSLFDQTPAERSRLETFYTKNAQNVEVVWSSKRIVKVIGFNRKQFSFAGKTAWFYKFQVQRASSTEKYTITEADFPRINPSDLLFLANHFKNNMGFNPKHGEAYHAVRRFLIDYLCEFGRIDFELAPMTASPPTRNPDYSLPNIESRDLGVTLDPEPGIIFNFKNQTEKKFLRMKEKFLVPTSFLEKLLARAMELPGSDDAKKTVSDIITWWISARNWMLCAIGSRHMLQYKED